MFILSIGDFWSNLGQALQGFLQQIPDWNWADILSSVKDVLLSGSGIAVVGLLIKFGVPFFKDKTIFKKLVELYDEFKALKEENRTVGNLFNEWIEMQSEINKDSQTLTTAQKDKLKLLAQKMRDTRITEIQDTADKIDETVEDNVVTLAEGKEVLETIQPVKDVFGTKL